jgi:flavin reductase (DIM6/NTAB) family NADH-FMN oxidoreductase RutF
MISDQAAFRKALGLYATGVAIVTAKADGADLLGITINSFSSVSLDPALILFSASKNLRSLEKLARADAWAINVLSRDQTDISRRFAQPGSDKWSGVEWIDGHHGVPVLPGALAVFECEPYARYSGGDHDILLGQVVRYTTTPERAPLVFFAGSYQEVAL